MEKNIGPTEFKSTLSTSNPIDAKSRVISLRSSAEGGTLRY